MASPLALADINPGKNDSNPEGFVVADSQVFFTAYSPEYGRELWRTDGTAEGTRLVKDIRPGTDGIRELYSSIYEYAVLNNSIYFGANDGASGFELWVSDGSNEGTSIVADLSPGAASSSIDNILAASDYVYFELDGSLWRIGTNQEAPSLVKSKEMPPDSVWNPGLGYTYPAGGFDLDAIIEATSDVVFLDAKYRAEGSSWSNNYLWAYNIKDESLQPLRQVNQYYDSAIFRDRLFYGDSGLWVSDGSIEGTALIRENVNPSRLVVAGNYLYFANGDKELWRTDGTGEGTALVKVLTGNESDRYGFFFQALGESVVFEWGYDLWISDGTASGTRQIADVLPDLSYVSVYSKSAVVSGSGDSLYLADYLDGIYRVSVSESGSLSLGYAPVDGIGSELSLWNDTLVFGVDDLFSDEEWRFGEEPFSLAVSALNADQGGHASGESSASGSTPSGSSSSSPAVDSNTSSQIPSETQPTNPGEPPATPPTVPIAPQPSKESPVLGIQPQETISTAELITPIVLGNLLITKVVIGTSARDVITGSDEAEALAGGKGKDRKTGGGGPDAFVFETLDEFGKKSLDVITDFNPDQGDKIVIASDAFEGISKVKFTSVSGKGAARNAASSNKTFIYNEKKGVLYFNENGRKDEFGAGGEFVRLLGSPEIAKADIVVV